MQLGLHNCPDNVVSTTLSFRCLLSNATVGFTGGALEQSGYVRTSTARMCFVGYILWMNPGIYPGMIDVRGYD